ncbi:hypothetical protein [Butyrivibrio sp. AE2032]|uniref:hypothetical protein n=1 Tax=Butyrivibrio sp. AE2032 TaxID=1458463 RepID=UPI000554A59F|nr:hypothetical protein [Butyrivibrio sp. AE2032]
MVARNAKHKTRRIVIPVMIAAVFICLAVIPFARAGKNPNVTIVSPVIPLYEVKDTHIPLPYSDGAAVVTVYYDFHLLKRDIYILGLNVSTEAYTVKNVKNGEKTKVTDIERYRSILDKF